MTNPSHKTNNNKSNKRSSKNMIQTMESVAIDIEKTLQNHHPELEPEIQEYLNGFLQDFLSAPMDDDDFENIESTLTEFLTPKACRQILNLFTLNTSTDSHTNPRSPLVAKQKVTFASPITSNGDNDKEEVPPEVATKSHKQLRKERRQNKKKTKKATTSDFVPDPPPTGSSGELLDDHASAWKDRLAEGKLWGGRGHGGRGLRITGENLANIHLPSVSLTFEGNDLLSDSPMDIVRGHRYGLLGRNGVGKSTLLRHLAHRGIPGIPHSMRILLVHQQIEGRDDQSTLDALVAADFDRTALLQEQDQVEKYLEDGIELEKNAQRLNDIVAELDAIESDTAEDRAREILKGLSFTQTMIEGTTSHLSGGWRMRLALAQALFVPSADLILLDECTNHLDLQGMDWLIRYLTTTGEGERTLIVVSHDRAFLDAICTDMIVMEHQRLNYHIGNYTEYQRQVQEKVARQSQILDSSERQRSKAMAFVQSNQHSKDPNKQRQAKMAKDKKLDRIGNYREDGKRYQNFSLKQMDMATVRLAQKVHIERDERVIRLKFPNPSWPPGMMEGDPLVRLEHTSFQYNSQSEALLQDLTLNISRGSKIALVGKNGCGKTTLVKLVTGELEKKGTIRGNLWVNPNLRIGHVSQYSVEELEQYAQMTVVQYAEEKLKNGRPSSTVIKEASGNVRQYLGSFGLGGAHAHRTISKLSGGERMRLCFATILADQPHMLCLDESTNHVDLETLDSMASALKAYQGAVFMVSHNQAFLSGFCNQLWVLEDGGIQVKHDHAESFDELFAGYRNHSLSSSAATGRKEARRLKSGLAHRATKQSAGAKVGTTLFA